MAQERIRVVVGEGHPSRKGVLRFVLEGEGHDVVAEAADGTEVARVVAAERPDVVVLDDGIGVTAVQAARDASSATKVILVWPSAVMPIGGDARVDPDEILRDLGPAVRRVLGRPAGGLETFRRPEWVDRIRKDPATLRELLDRRGGLPTRPSVTELQRATASSPPASARPAETVAPLVILPDASSDDEPVVVVDAPAAQGEPAASADGRPNDERERDAAVVAFPTTGAAAASADPMATEWNSRLGTLALGGAAVIGALVIALGIGTPRVPTDVVAAERPSPSIAPPSPGDDEPGDDGDTTDPGRDGDDGGGGDGGGNGGGVRPDRGIDGAVSPPTGGDDGGDSGGDGGGGNDGGGNDGGGDNGGGDNGGGDNGGGDGDGNGGGDGNGNGGNGNGGDGNGGNGNGNGGGDNGGHGGNGDNGDGTHGRGGERGRGEGHDKDRGKGHGHGRGEGHDKHGDGDDGDDDDGDDDRPGDRGRGDDRGRGHGHERHDD